MTAGVMPDELLDKISPEYVCPIVAYLCHKDSNENGRIIESAAGAVKALRLERDGTYFKRDDSFTPSAVLNKWEEVTSFSNEPTYPEGASDPYYMLEKSDAQPTNKQGEEISFKDQTVVISGAGNGIGREYALLCGKLGANVVVNDLVDPSKVVEEIKKAGGKAVGDNHNVLEGEKIIKTAVDNFGTVHAVINNAGILRDKSFLKMTDKQWDDVYKVHLLGTYKLTHAAWPYFLKNKYGRVVCTASTSAMGNYGQANYAFAKSALISFAKTLSIEGQSKNIFANAVAPVAASAMTANLFPQELLDGLKPAYNAPPVVLFASDKCPTTGTFHEIGAGFVGMSRWQQSGGVGFGTHKPMTIEQVAEKWDKIVDFDNGKATYPSSGPESIGELLELAQEGDNGDDSQSGESGDSDGEVGIFEYDSSKIILYNLGIGAGTDDLDYVYEGRENFRPVPTFGVLPYFSVPPTNLSKAVPNFNPMKLLHGEQYMEILQWPIPDAATLETRAKTLDVVDKGKAAVVTTEFHTVDKADGKPIFYNVSTVFLRGSGGFGGPKKGEDRGAITAANTPPSRKPDFVNEYKVGKDQAALYRLSGDFNPLHIDPDFAAVGNFPQPILHGLCSMGISARLLTDKFGRFKNIKVRFTGHVFPGETLRVVAWKENNKVLFETHVVERGTKAISAAAIELVQDGGKSKL